MDAQFTIDGFRIFLHVLGVTVWVGGQIVMLSILPVLRAANVEGLPAQVAQGFQRVAWPAFALIIFTGIWNVLAVDLAEVSSSYNMIFGIKMMCALVSGASAYIHAKASKPSVKGMTGALGLLAALATMFLGYAL